MICQSWFFHDTTFIFIRTTDEKYHLQNYPSIIADQQQQTPHHYSQLQHSHPASNKNSSEHEPNNNNNGKNNSSSSSYEDTIDYDDSIQNHDIKESSSKKENHAKYPYEHHPQAYNGASSINDEYRIASIESNERKNLHCDDTNSNDIRMSYASSDEMNQNAVSSDHGEKLNSGSEDEGKENFRIKNN